MATLTRLYDTRADAEATVAGLEAAGIGHDEISLVGGYRHENSLVGGYRHENSLVGGYRPEPAGEASPRETSHDEAGKVAGAGATAGTIIGGGVGLATGIGAMAIPGVGPVVAAGWLVAALTGAGVGAAVGAGTGGLIGALTHEGVSEEDANVYAEGIRRGGYLVTVRVESTRVAEAQRLLSHRGVDTAARRTAYEGEGWTRFDEAGRVERVSERVS